MLSHIFYYVSVFRSQNRVIAHDQHGVVISCRYYDDNHEDLDSIFIECSSPEIPKEYRLLLTQGNKQGAARLDYIPKSNISELMLEGKFNDTGEEYHSKSEIPMKQGTKVKDTVFNRNVTFDRVNPSQTQLPHISIIPASDQLHQQSSISHLSSTLPHVLPTNQAGSVIACTIGSTNQIQNNDLIYGKSTTLDQLSNDNVLHRFNQIHRLQRLPNALTNAIGGPFTSQVIPPLSICSNPPSLNHSALVHSNIDSDLHENVIQPLLIKQDYTSQTSINETNSPKIPILDSFSTASNIPLISKNMSGVPNMILSSLPNHIDRDQHPKDIQKGVFPLINQNDQLQPHIPRLSQVDSVNFSQLQSVSNNQLQTQSDHQIQSHDASPSSISLTQINRVQPHINVVMAPISENRPSVSAGNLVDIIPCSIEQNKLAYQHYVNYLHSQYYSQLNALMLSQFHSSGQPIHTQLPSSTLPLSLSQLTQIPSHAIPSQNQVHDLPQVPSLPLSGIFPYNNEIIPQYSTFSFSTERDHVPNLNKSDKK